MTDFFFNILKKVYILSTLFNKEKKAGKEREREGENEKVHYNISLNISLNS